MKKFLLLLFTAFITLSINATTYHADIETVATATNYGTRTTTTGWKATNAAVNIGGEGDKDANPMYRFIGYKTGSTTEYARTFTINGKKSAFGIITSPELETGCKKLTFNYGYPFAETGNLSFRVDIKKGDVVAKTFTTTIAREDLANTTKYQFSEYINITGNFVIEITNLCPTGSTSNKDRIAVWNIDWTDGIDCNDDLAEIYDYALDKDNVTINTPIQVFAEYNGIFYARLENGKCSNPSKGTKTYTWEDDVTEFDQRDWIAVKATDASGYVDNTVNVVKGTYDGTAHTATLNATSITGTSSFTKPKLNCYRPVNFTGSTEYFYVTPQQNEMAKFVGFIDKDAKGVYYLYEKDADDKVYLDNAPGVINDSHISTAAEITAGQYKSVTGIVSYLPKSAEPAPMLKVAPAGKEYSLIILSAPEIATSVEGTVATATAKVIGGVGEINVIGDASNIETYTIGGALVSKNQANIYVAAGLYIVKVDGIATKVIVK